MDTYVVAVVTTNKKPDDPPAVTMFAVCAASEADAIKAAKGHVVAPTWATEARVLPKTLPTKQGEAVQL